MSTLFAAWFLALILQTGPETPQQVLDRAIKAVGGEQMLRKLANSQYRSEVTAFVAGQAQPGGQEKTLIKLPDCIKVEITDRKQAGTFALHGSEGWVQMDGQTEKMRPHAVESMQEDLHCIKLQYLVGAKDPRYQLKMLPPKRVEGVLSDGILVSGEGVPDVSLYFDKRSGLLVKSEMRLRDPMLGHIVFREVFLKDYEDVQGLKYPMHIVIYNDYSRYREVKMKDVKFLENIRDSEFQSPG